MNMYNSDNMTKASNLRGKYGKSLSENDLQE